MACETIQMTSGYNMCLGSDRCRVLKADTPNLNPAYSMFSLRSTQMVFYVIINQASENNTKSVAAIVVNDPTEASDCKKVWLFFMDFSKAFETVYHFALINRLCSIGKLNWFATITQCCQFIGLLIPVSLYSRECPRVVHWDHYHFPNIC